MARWKANNDGSPYYDPNDDGPDQVAVPQGYNADGTQQGQTPAAQNPYPTQGGEQPEGQNPYAPTDGTNQTPQWGDTSKVPSYPYMMSGQDGWPDMSQWAQQPTTSQGAPPGIDGATQSSDPNAPGYRAPLFGANGGITQNPDGSYTFGGVTTPPGWQMPPYDPNQAIPIKPTQTGLWNPNAPKLDPNTGIYSDGSIPGGGPAPAPPASAPPPAANPAWDTDQFAAPQYQANRANEHAMPGWDQTKWADPNQQTPKYAVGRILSQFPTTGAGLSAAIPEIQKAYPGTTFDGKDKLNIPGVGTIDVLVGAGEGGKAWQWGALTGPDGKPLADQAAGATGGGAAGQGLLGYGGGAGGAGGSGSGGGGGYTSSSSYTSGGAPNYGNYGERGNTLWDQLMGRANQTLQVGAKDPIIANQVNSYRAEQTRGVRDQLAQVAEAGGPTANLNGERRMANEKASRATGGLQATLMQNELTARRNEIQQALSQMGSMLSDQQKTALSRELGLLNAGMDQQRINNQNNQFLDDLGLRATDRASYWDAIRSGLIS